MLVVDKIRNDFDGIVKAMEKRGLTLSEELKQIVALDDQRKQVQFEMDNKLAEMNSLSKTIGELFKSGKAQEANEKKAATKQLKEEIAANKEQLSHTQAKLNELLFNIPNIPNEKVVFGKSDADNEILSYHGEWKKADHKLPHWEITKKYDLVDFETGVKITGAGFPLYKGKGAKLQRSLVQYFLDFNVDKGYEEVIPPFVVNEQSGIGTGSLPDKEGQMYYIAEDDLYLIPTAEIPVTNIYRDDLLKSDELPKLNTAYSPCFRREAGSYGKDVRGLNRLHQFEKVEIVRIEKPESSYQALDAMVQHVGELLEKLELPYRILRLCGGDLTFASALTYDFEVYSSAQDKWLEVSSVSNFEDYQANRLKLRYKEDGKSQLCHTLNGSALALPRIMACLLENHQDENGLVHIPKALQAYTGFNSIG